MNAFCIHTWLHYDDMFFLYSEEVRQMFQHAYNSYLTYAYPYDELRPLSCDGIDTWGR
jgi:mannosidase alpha-like ER degradation enhancer 2